MAQQQTAKEQLMLSIPGMFPDKSVDWKARAVTVIGEWQEDRCRALLNLQPEEVKLAAIAASLDGKAGNRTACALLHVVTAFVLLWHFQPFGYMQQPCSQLHMVGMFEVLSREP
jgi:hypothetical protein